MQLVFSGILGYLGSYIGSQLDGGTSDQHR